MGIGEPMLPRAGSPATARALGDTDLTNEEMQVLKDIESDSKNNGMRIGQGATPKKADESKDSAESEDVLDDGAGEEQEVETANEDTDKEGLEENIDTTDDVEDAVDSGAG